MDRLAHPSLVLFGLNFVGFVVCRDEGFRHALIKFGGLEFAQHVVLP